MIKASLTATSFKAMATSDTDRRKAVGTMLEGIGGKLIGYYFAFGDDDIIVIAEAPDNVTMASVAINITSSGSLHGVSTTPLLSYEDGVKAIKSSTNVNYTPPGN